MASNGIDFVIGGKDQARPAMASVEQSLTRLEQKTNALGIATSGLAKLTGGLVAAWAAINSAAAIIGGIDAINSAYDDAADATSELNVALKLQGVNVDAESTRLQKFADEIQQLTGINDDATLSLMRQAALLGTSSDQLDDMAQASIGLAEAMGTDTASAMRVLRQATEGHFDSLNKAIPALRNMTTDEEKLAAVLELSARGFEAKATWSNKVSESGAHASTAIDKLMESVGAILAPFRVLISSGIEVLAESLTTLLVPAVTYAEETLANIGPMMDWVKAKVIDGVNLMVGAFTFFEVILTNLDQVWTAVVAQAELSMLQMAGSIKHTLMEVIPAYATWFGKNFITMLMGDFDAAMAAMPDIAVRAITQREKELSEIIGQVGANLGQQFADKFAQRTLGMGGGIADEFSSKIDLKVNKQLDEAGVSKRKDGTFGTSINAMESRLLTRGPGSTMESLLQDIANKMDRLLGKPGLQNDDKNTIDAIKKAAENKALLVTVQ